MPTSWIYSIGIHAIFIAFVYTFSLIGIEKKNSKIVEQIDFEVIEETMPSLEDNIPDVKEVEDKPIDIAQKKPDSSAPSVRKNDPPVERVFGLSKDTLVDDAQGVDSGVSLKKGNTLSKAQDNKELKDDRPLPVPRPEFLVDQMPIVIAKAPRVYPEEARNKNIEGTVNLSVLIDSTGSVRRVKIINEPGYGLGTAAQNAMLKYKFKPAMISGQPTAVEIRYPYVFSLK